MIACISPVRRSEQAQFFASAGIPTISLACGCLRAFPMASRAVCHQSLATQRLGGRSVRWASGEVGATTGSPSVCCALLLRARSRIKAAQLQLSTSQLPKPERFNCRETCFRGRSVQWGQFAAMEPDRKNVSILLGQHCVWSIVRL